ncbi:MAG: hypothetical protein WA751_05550 [Candidatus Dormiibacterota bacterium]
MTTPEPQNAGQRALQSLLQVCCSPPQLSGDTRSKRFTDRLLPRGLWLCLFFALIAIGVSAAPHLPLRAGLALGSVTTLLASTYCLLNFWRCREAHCIVSGTGWALLALFEFAELGVGRSLIDRSEGLAFLIVLALAYAFEATWRLRYGTNSVTGGARRGWPRRAI